MKFIQESECLNFETFFRSNQETCLSQRPLVKQGQWINKGQPLTDSLTSASGDLALGKNVLVAYMPWEGYNFEDSIVISDRLVADDVYTSLHILRFKTEIDYTTKELIPEEDVPDSVPDLVSNVPSFLNHLANDSNKIQTNKLNTPQEKISKEKTLNQLIAEQDTFNYAAINNSTSSFNILTNQGAFENSIIFGKDIKTLNLKGFGKRKSKPSGNKDLLKLKPSFFAKYKAKNKKIIANISYNSLLFVSLKKSNCSYLLKTTSALIRSNPSLHSLCRLVDSLGKQNKKGWIDCSTLLAPLSKPKKKNWQAEKSSPLILSSNQRRKSQVKETKPLAVRSLFTLTKSKDFTANNCSEHGANKVLAPRAKQRTKLSLETLSFMRLKAFSEAKVLLSNKKTTNKKNLLSSKKLNRDAMNEPFFNKNRVNQDKVNRNKQVFNIEKRTNNIPFLEDRFLSHLNPDGIAKIGAWVSPGDILVGKVRPVVNKLKSNRAGTQLALEIIAKTKPKSIGVEDTSFRLPKGVSGRILRTEVFSNASNEQIHIYLVVKRKIQVGDKLAGRHGNKGIVSLILPRQEMPYLADGTPIDVILSPLGVPSRMNVGQIYECLLGLAAVSLGCDFIVNNSVVTLGDKSLYFAKTLPKTKTNLQTNQLPLPLLPLDLSVKSKILQNSKLEENYYRQNKTKSLTSLQNYLFPNNSLNLGNIEDFKNIIRTNDNYFPKQITSDVSKKIKTTTFFNFVVRDEKNINNNKKYNSNISLRLLEKIKIINDKKKRNIIKDKNRYNIGTLYQQGSMHYKTLEKNNTKSMYMLQGTNKKVDSLAKTDNFVTKSLMCLMDRKNKQTPINRNANLLFASSLKARSLVFLKLYYSRITCNKKWLFSMTNPGKIRLFDGRTGQPFVSWVTVGYAYMLKLIHLVDTKMHSRSTGPYSLITRQAVRGKARQGGQRIGEMEAWALEGFGAAYTLQELFSYKGDDASSRRQRYVSTPSKLVGNNTAFKMLLSELRALCVSLEFTGFTEHIDSEFIEDIEQL